MKVELTVTKGPHQGAVFAFREPDIFVVGRSKDAHFRLPQKDKFFSRNHFMVEVSPPLCRLMDMASTNGTFVNDKKATRVELRDGDTIRGGQTVIRVAIDADEPAPRAESTPPEARTGTPQAIAGYRIERELGRGGMGVVYLASRGDGPPVALKSILPALATAEGAVDRFLREASVLRRLDHPHIVAFRDIGHADGFLYFAMDYVDGVDAFQFLKEHGGPLPIPVAVELVCQALDGLGYAHDRGFVHRDIKPPNLLVSHRDGRPFVLVADFGLARLYQTSTLSGLTLKDDIFGSFGYIAPEQITHFREAKPPADQYSAAATLYFLLTGCTPHDFQGRIEQRLLAILQDDPTPIRERRKEIPPKLANVVHRSLARAPEDRFPDVKALGAALAGFRSTPPRWPTTSR